MRKWIFVLLLSLLMFPPPCLAAVPGFMKERMGTLSGQVIDESGEPLKGGRVSFFNSTKGIPPLIGKVHRIPDMVGRMGADGKFSIKLLPGSYYMGALIITDPGRGLGPPREGETFYFIRGEKGKFRELTLGIREKKDVGRITAALPDSFDAAKKLVTIEGRLLKEGSTPFVGGYVLVKTDINKARPDFVSARTGKDGKFSLKLPADTHYYLLGREQTVGRAVPGSYIGTYGSTSSISEGGALPVANMRPVQPVNMPQVEGVEIGPGGDLPVTVSGKAGATLTGLDIMMFKVPVPGELREKLQGTLGLGSEFKEKMDRIVPLKSAPATKKE